MKTYVAQINSLNIISVEANNEAEARKEISTELQKPGRQNYYTAWINNGQVIVEK